MDSFDLRRAAEHVQIHHVRGPPWASAERHAGGAGVVGNRICKPEGHVARHLTDMEVVSTSATAPSGARSVRCQVLDEDIALVTIAGLTTLAAEPQLELHINTGFNVGLTQDEVVARPQMPLTGDTPGPGAYG